MGTKKLTFVSIEGVEKSLFRWFFSRRYRLVFLFFVVSILVAADFVPYTNLLLNSYLIVLISLVLTPFILKIDSEVFLAVGIVSFFVVALLWFIGQTEEAEILTEYIFVILFSGSFRAFLSS